MKLTVPSLAIFNGFLIVSVSRVCLKWGETSSLEKEDLAFFGIKWKNSVHRFQGTSGFSCRLRCFLFQAMDQDCKAWYFDYQQNLCLVKTVEENGGKVEIEKSFVFVRKRTTNSTTTSTTTTTTTTTFTTSTTTIETTATSKAPPLICNLKRKQIDNANASCIYKQKRGVWGPQFAIDDEVISGKHTLFYHSDLEYQPWFQITFTEVFTVTGVTVTNRFSGRSAIPARFREVQVSVGFRPLTMSGRVSRNPLCGTFKGPSTSGAEDYIPCQNPMAGKYLVVQLQFIGERRLLQINEIVVDIHC